MKEADIRKTHNKYAQFASEMILTYLHQMPALQM